MDALVCERRFRTAPLWRRAEGGASNVAAALPQAMRHMSDGGFSETLPEWMAFRGWKCSAVIASNGFARRFRLQIPQGTAVTSSLHPSPYAFTATRPFPAVTRCTRSLSGPIRTPDAARSLQSGRQRGKSNCVYTELGQKSGPRTRSARNFARAGSPGRDPGPWHRATGKL